MCVRHKGNFSTTFLFMLYSVGNFLYTIDVITWLIHGYSWILRKIYTDGKIGRIEWALMMENDKNYNLITTQYIGTRTSLICINITVLTSICSMLCYEYHRSFLQLFGIGHDIYIVCNNSLLIVTISSESVGMEDDCDLEDIGWQIIVLPNGRHTIKHVGRSLGPRIIHMTYHSRAFEWINLKETILRWL